MGNAMRPQNRRRKSLAARVANLLVAVVAVALFVGFCGLVVPPMMRLVLDAVAGPGGRSVVADFPDYCADSLDATKLRAKMLYTDPRYMEQKPAAIPDDDGDGPHAWCVIGTTYPSDVWWVIAYAGVKNPLYRTMLAENGSSDNATRAVITYQGIPPIAFAREGWLGFITPGDDVWSDLRAGAGAELLRTLANDAAVK